MTDLALIEASWDQAARENATFNILTDPNHRDGWELAEFFAHGRREIDAAMMRMAAPHADRRPMAVIDDFRDGRALDFGCGVGRITRALGHWFAGVDGVDISEEMIDRAREFNASDALTFHHNSTSDLALFADGTFDFVYSMIVLQHMPQEMQHGYVNEFFRVLKPGGVAMFHTPEGPDSGHPGWHLSMFGVTRDTVEQWIGEAGGTLIDVEDLGQDSGWRNLRYTATA